MRSLSTEMLWLPVACVLLAMPLGAHHSISAEFDTAKTFTVKGTLTELEWVNPHTYVYLDSNDDKGAVVAYSIEAGPPGNLRRAGILKTMFTVGDVVTIDAYASKDGTKQLGLMRSITFADGHKIVMGKDPAELEKLNKSE